MALRTWTVGQVSFTGDDVFWDKFGERLIPSFLPSVSVPVGVHLLLPPEYYHDNSDALILSPTMKELIYFVYLTREGGKWKTVIVEFSERGMDYRTESLPVDFNFVIDPSTTRLHETLDDYQSDWVAAAVSYLTPQPIPTITVFTLIRYYEPPTEYMKNKFVLSVQLIPLSRDYLPRSYYVIGVLPSLLDLPMWCWYPIVPCPNGVLFPLGMDFEIGGDELIIALRPLDPDPDYNLTFLQFNKDEGTGCFYFWGMNNEFVPYIFGSWSVAGGTKPAYYPIIPSRSSSVFRRFNYDDIKVETVTSSGIQSTFDVDRFAFGSMDLPYAVYGDVRSIYSAASTNVRWGRDDLFPYYVKTGHPYFVPKVGGFMNVKDLSNNEHLLPVTVHESINEDFVNRLLFPSGTYSITRFPPIWGWISDDLLFLTFGKRIGPILPFSPFPLTDTQNSLSPLTLPATANSPFYLPLLPLVPLRPYEALMWMDRTFTVRVGHPVFIPHGDVFIPVVVLTSSGVGEEGRIGIFRFKRSGTTPYRIKDVEFSIGSGGQMVLTFTPPPTGPNRVCYFIVEQILQPENPLYFSNPVSILSHSLFHTRDWEVDFEGNGNWRPFSGVVKKLSPLHPPKKIRVKLSVPSLSQYVRVLSVMRRES